MLSYQHAYHAGNAADVHKHALLAWVLAYMVQKPKPISYIETHGGRALYDLSGEEARKTGEAAAGIGRCEDWFAPDHPYAQALAAAREQAGASAYPGSPMIARSLLRDADTLTIAEKHPQEAEALRQSLRRVWIRHADGPELALSMTPPEPKRGVMLVDPSWELKDEYRTIPEFLAKVHRKWPVGVLILWYPILTNGAHMPMIHRLRQISSEALVSEVSFPPAREGHGMVGSGLWVVNPPWGFDKAAAELARKFKSLSPPPSP